MKWKNSDYSHKSYFHSRAWMRKNIKKAQQAKQMINETLNKLILLHG